MQRRTLLLALPFCAAPAGAQGAYPARPVRVIAPQAPGGGVDLVGRIVAERLGRRLGQTFVIDNQAGAGGSIAAQMAARAVPDGYTLMIGYVATHATNPAVRKVPYDAVRDFTPIGMIGGTPNLLVCRPSLPVNTLAEFVAYARAQPNKVNYGTSGVGTLNHLVMEQFKNAAGFQSLAVPYRSIGQAFIDIIGGQVQAIFPGLAAGLPHVRAGKVRALAVTGATRHRLLPEVPTLKELGYEHFEGVTWYGLVGPARLPPAIVRRLNEELNAMLAQADLREQFAAEALEPMPMTPAQFGDYIAEEIRHWTQVAQANHISGD